MTGAIARHEIRNQLRDGRFRWSGITILILLLFSLLAGFDQHQRVVTEREEVQRTMRQQWLEQGEKNPHSAAHFSIYAFRSPLPLAFFDRGVEPYTGSAIWLEAHYRNEAVYSPARDATSLSRFGQLTAAATLQLLVPLLIVVLGAGLFAGEREDGTLRFVASQGVSPGRLALGKALGLGGALLGLFVPAAILGAAALVASGGAFDPAELRLRALGLAGAYLLYFGIFLGLTLAVSALSSGRRPALLALLTVWAFNGLIAQRLVPVAANALHPLPSWHAFQAAIAADKREGIDGHNPTGERAAELERQLLDEYEVESVDDLPIDFSGVALQADEEYGALVYDRHYGALRQTYAAQDRIHLLGAVMAPALAIRDLSMSLAGSDAVHHAHFTDAAEVYRRDIVRRLNEEVIYTAPDAYELKLGDRELWESIPDFTYDPPSAAWAFAGQSGRIAVLLLWSLASLGVSAATASRFRLDG